MHLSKINKIKSGKQKMKEIFREINFQKKNLYLLEKMKEILEEYEEQEIKVTLRQLYYQLVSRDVIPNKVSEYIKLSKLLTNARYTGDIDWESIEDRTRIPNIPQTFSNIKHLLDVASRSYQLDKWEGQEFYIELWTEKDAISSVISPVTEKYQVPVSVNRGYSSASAMYEASKRFKEKELRDITITDPKAKQYIEKYGNIFNCWEERELIILYLGDHDPSGLDMDRDIQNRLEEFGVDVEVVRIGLTTEQINQYSPPPNPTKITDPRAKEYISEYGETSWEVDAIKPEVLQELIERFILKYLDLERFEQVEQKEQKEIQELEKWKEKK